MQLDMRDQELILKINWIGYLEQAFKMNRIYTQVQISGWQILLKEFGRDIENDENAKKVQIEIILYSLYGLPQSLKFYKALMGVNKR